jgi:hypothetical protein
MFISSIDLVDMTIDIKSSYAFQSLSNICGN